MHEYRLTPAPPFSFELTASLLSPGSRDHVDVFDGKRYTRLLELDGRMRLALVSSLGSEQRPELIITLMNGSEHDERPISRVLMRMFGMEFELADFYEMCRHDTHLYRLCRGNYGLRPVQRLRPFETLALCIVGKEQKIHYLDATLSSIAEAHCYNVAYAGHTFCSFPNVETMVERPLRALARAPIDAVQAKRLATLARLVRDGRLDFKALHRRPTSELLTTIAGIDGVGKLGAQFAVLFGFGRLECFPVDDPVLLKWISRNVLDSSRVNRKAAAAWTEQWGEWRGLVAMYIYSELRNHSDR